MVSYLVQHHLGLGQQHVDSITLLSCGDRIVFLYSVKNGPASQSYGLQVARLAGVPEPVIAESQLKLAILEAQYVDERQSNDVKNLNQASLLPESKPEEQAVMARVKAAVPDDLTPRQALDLMYDLHKMLGKKGRK